MEHKRAVPVRAYKELILISISGANIALGLKQELPESPINYMQGKNFQDIFQDIFKYPWWKKLLCYFEI